MTTKPKEQDHDVKHWWVFPYRWNWKSAFSDVWNEKEKRIFPPKQFGVGWGLNFHALMKKIKRK
jgi:hypothetical protein